MKASAKTWLIIIALALLACLVVFSSRSHETIAPGLSDTSQGPSFELFVVKPRLARPLFGILPTRLEEKLEAGGELRFDHTNRGAMIGSVEPHRLELRADDWALFIKTDEEGEISSGTYLVYTMMLAEKQRRLRCRPAEQTSGYLRTIKRAGSNELDGSFLIELATCENDETGRGVEWPPAPLTVHGSFRNLTLSRR